MSVFDRRMRNEMESEDTLMMMLTRYGFTSIEIFLVFSRENKNINFVTNLKIYCIEAW
jgi:hypothetical protein